MKTLTAFVLTLSTAVHSETLIGVREKLDRSIYACPERIWPGMDWKTQNIIVINEEGTRSELFRGDKTTQLPDSVAANMRGLFDFAHWEGEPALYYQLDPGMEENFETIIHEAFHYFGQGRLSYPINRSDLVPFDPTPRLLRAELIAALQSYLKGEPAALGRARGWHDQHVATGEKLGPDEIEGSAEYVGVIANLLAELGCDAPEDLLISRATDRIMAYGIQFQKDVQSYMAGSLALLVARTRGIDAPSRLDGTQRLLDLALENVGPVLAPPTPQIAKEGTLQISELNDEVMSGLVPLREAISQGKPFVFVALDSLRGSYSARGSFDAVEGNFLLNLEVNTDQGQFVGHAWQVQACGGQQGFLILTDALPGGTPSTYGASPITCY